MSATGKGVQKHSRVEVHADADIEEVWALVVDVTRIGEWSHECVGGQWRDGATVAAPSVRFRGRNRAGIFRWGRVCEVVEAEPYTFRWRTVPTWRYPDSTDWSITLSPAPEGGTHIVQRYDVVKAPKILDRVFAVAIPGHRDRTAALTADLERLGAVSARRRPATTG